MNFYPTSVGFLFGLRPFDRSYMTYRTYYRDDEAEALDEDDGLRARDLETLPTTDVSTGEHIVNAHQVVSRFLKTRTVLLVRAFWRLWLPGSLQPANIVFGPFAAVRTTVRGLLYFFLLVEEIPFIHKC